LGGAARAGLAVAARGVLLRHAVLPLGLRRVAVEVVLAALAPPPAESAPAAPQRRGSGRGGGEPAVDPRAPAGGPADRVPSGPHPVAPPARTRGRAEPRARPPSGRPVGAVRGTARLLPRGRGDPPGPPGGRGTGPAPPRRGASAFSSHSSCSFLRGAAQAALALRGRGGAAVPAALEAPPTEPGTGPSAGGGAAPSPRGVPARGARPLLRRRHGAGRGPRRRGGGTARRARLGRGAATGGTPARRRLRAARGGLRPTGSSGTLPRRATAGGRRRPARARRRRLPRGRTSARGSAAARRPAQLRRPGRRAARGLRRAHGLRLPAATVVLVLAEAAVQVRRPARGADRPHTCQPRRPPGGVHPGAGQRHRRRPAEQQLPHGQPPLLDGVGVLLPRLRGGGLGLGDRRLRRVLQLFGHRSSSLLYRSRSASPTSPA